MNNPEEFEVSNYEFEERQRWRKSSRVVDDHAWVGILGHPDDDECSVCGRPEHRHKETTR